MLALNNKRGMTYHTNEKHLTIQTNKKQLTIFPEYFIGVVKLPYRPGVKNHRGLRTTN